MLFRVILQSAEQANTIAVQQSKEIAAKQKAALPDLYGSRNRPDTDNIGDLYIVSTSFVTEWRRFIKLVFKKLQLASFMFNSKDLQISNPFAVCYLEIPAELK